MLVSGWDSAGLFGDKVPEAVLDFVPVPGSDPLTDAAELCAPPALAELREYTDDTDMRLESISDKEGLGFSTDSDSCERFASSAMIVGGNRGVSKSSTAISSLLVLLLPAIPCLQLSACIWVRALYVEEVRDRGFGLTGGGMEMLARSEFASVAPGSTCRPFLLEDELTLEAEDRLCEFLRGLSFGVGFSLSCREVSTDCWRLGSLVAFEEAEEPSCWSI